jgi:hypothetical protein
MVGLLMEWQLGWIDFFAFIVFVFSFFVMKRAGGVLNFFNPACMFIIFHVGLLGVAGWYRELYSYAIVVADEVLYVIYVSLFLFSCGVLFAVKFPRARYAGYGHIDSISEGFRLYSGGALFRLGVLAVPIVISLYYSWLAGGFVWQNAGGDDFRVEVRKGVGWIALLGIAAAFVGVLLYIYSKKRISLFEGGVVVLVLSVCAASYGNRAPGADVFLAGFFSLLIVRYGRIPAVTLVVVGFCLFVLVMSLGLYRQGLDFSLMGVLMQVLWRPFVNFQNFQLLYDAFPSLIPFQYGYGYIIDASVLLPGYQLNYSTWLKDALGMEFSGGGINQTYIGEFYTNFSLVPALFASFLLGAFFQFLYRWMCVVRASPAVMLIVSFSLKGLVSSGLVSPVLYCLIPFFVLYFFYYFIYTLLGGRFVRA